MNRTVLISVLGVAAMCVVAYGSRGTGGALPGGVSLPGSLGQGSSAASAPLGTVETAQVTLEAASINGRGRARNAVVGNGGSVVLGASYHLRYSGRLPELNLSLERKSASGSWVTTAAVVTRSIDGALLVRTPPYSTSASSESIDYRLVSDPVADPGSVAVTNTSHSQPVRVTYENQRDYTGIAAAIYEDAAAYCPNTAVHIADLGGTEAGDYASGGLLIRIDPAVGVTVNTRPIDLRAVALHECSHERQWLNYGGTAEGHEQMRADAARIFSDATMPAGAVTPDDYRDPEVGLDPIEHAADCGAQALNPGGYLGYGGYCTPNQLDAGRRLLLGQRY